jgi:PAS domain S-box-containing protein
MKGYIAEQAPGHPARLAVIRYAGAVAAVVVGVLLAVWLEAVLDAAVVLLMAILVAAWFSGFWPALLASALATVALDYFFTPPLYTFALEIAHIPHLLVFTLIASLFVSISAARRHAEQSLTQARDQLDARVRERTADLTRVNQRLSTQYAVTRALADSGSLDAALPEVLRIIGTAMHWDCGVLWKVDREARVLRCASTWCAPGVTADAFAADHELAFGLGHGIPGQVWQSGQPEWIPDVVEQPGFVRTAAAVGAGFHGATAFPILVGNDTIGVVEFFSRSVRQRDQEELQTLSALGSQIGQVMERRRAEDERERLLVREQAAHAEAAASQQRFRDLVNSIEGIVWEADARTFQFTFVSRQAARVLGYPVEQWLEEPGFWKDHIHPEDRDSAVNLCVTATTERQDHDFEYRMVASDGRLVWLRDLVSVVVENNQATRLRGVMFDVTARRQAEEALREQANLLDLTHDTIFVRDMRDVIRYWNRGAEKLYGWTREEALGRITHELLRTRFPEPIEAVSAHVLRTGRWEGELVHTRRDGSQVVVASRWSLQRGADRNPVAVLETNNDITERKRAEAELRESERRHRHIFQATGVSIWEEDFSRVKAAIDALKQNGVSDIGEYIRTTPHFVDEAIAMVRIVDVNEATLKLFGASSKDALLVSLHHVFTPATRDVFAGELTAIAEGQTSFEGETILRKLNGESIVVLFSASFPPPDAPFDAVLVSIMDITERKRAEQELEELAGRLIHAQEEERSRIGRELHDHISQMLGVLTIRMDQLKADETTPPVVASALEELRQSTAEITDDIHGLSHRLHSSALDYLGLTPALQKLVNEFSTRHGIAIDFQHAALPAPLSAEVALCLFRVTEESLTNIAKHSGAKSAAVHVHGASDGIHLTIEDSGGGFDLDSLERRAGLGFVSMRERLRVLRGTVRVDSAPARGTRIDVWVPATSLLPAATGGAAVPASPPSGVSTA